MNESFITVSRRKLAALATLAGLCTLAAFPLATSATGQARSHTHATMLRLAQGVKLASGPLAAGKAAVWSVPASNGQRCTLLSVSDAPIARLSPEHQGGTCSPRDGVQPTPLFVVVNWLAAGNGRFYVVLYGTVKPGTGITNVELASTSGRVALAFRAGTFVGELPAVGMIGHINETLAPKIVGRDQLGNEVASVDITELLELAGSTL